MAGAMLSNLILVPETGRNPMNQRMWTNVEPAAGSDILAFDEE